MSRHGTQTGGTELDDLRRRLDTLHTELQSERSSFESHWRDLADNFLPRRYRRETSQTNRGEKKNQKIIDSTGTVSARTLSAGMMSGITSPARPWFRLQTSDVKLNTIGAVKEWLHEVTVLMRDIMIKSNLYRTLPLIYKDIGTFGTAAMLVEEDFENVLHTMSFPVGSYYMANDRKLRVRVFMREFRWTIRQVVEEYGTLNEKGKLLEKENPNISAQVISLYNEHKLDSWVEIIHVIMPNRDMDTNRLESRFKKFASITYETGRSTGGSYSSDSSDNRRFLRRAGMDVFPILAVRWEVAGEDIYGTDCPGMTSLGDTRQLQLGEKRGAQAIEKMINPPMVAPNSLRTERTSLLPGDVTYSDDREGQKGFRPAHEIEFRIDEHEKKQAQIRGRIRRVWYEDLFLLFAESDRRQITAAEIAAKQSEKLLALGPVLEQLNTDLLDPLIDLVFDYMDRQGILPEIPQELEGIDLKVEYISIMAQAQKLAGVNAIERFAGFVGGIAAQIGPEAVDKVNIDKLIDTHGEITSVPPGIVRTDEEVEEIRDQRQKAQADQVRAQGAKDVARAAKDFSETDVDKDSALRRILQLSGGGAAAPAA